jgi:hypothetical protein
MNHLKSFASGCLDRKALDGPDRKRWARHGSTRRLWKREEVSAAGGNRSLCSRLSHGSLLSRLLRRAPGR